MLFEFLSRFCEQNQLDIRDQAEQRALWDILAGLESSLPEVFAPDFGEELRQARDAVRDPVLATPETGMEVLGRIPTPQSEGAAKKDSFSYTFYSMNRARTRPDGTIAIPAGGYAHGKGIWDGTVQISPDSVAYDFWVWLMKRWPYESTLSSHDLPALDAEYKSRGN